MRVALKAADDSRTMFGILSNALTSSTPGITAVLAGIPQIFDSVDTAKTGAQNLVNGLQQADTASAALGEISRATPQLTAAVDGLRGISGVTGALRSTAYHLWQQLVEHPTPGSPVAIAQLDQLLTATSGFDTLAGVDNLDASLRSLTSATQNASTGIASAQLAATQLRDGLSTIATARTAAVSAVNQINLGTKQLKIALSSIDLQLKLIQDKLHAEAAQSQQAVAPSRVPDRPRQLAWALSAAGASGFLAYLIALAVHGRVRRTAPSAGLPASPLADLAREYPARTADGGTPSHPLHTDPSLPVQLSLALNLLDTPPHGAQRPTTDPDMPVQPPASDAITPADGMPAPGQLHDEDDDTP